MSGIRSLRRGATLLGFAVGASAPIYVNSSSNEVKVVPAGSGSTEVTLLPASGLTPATITASTATLGATHVGRTTVVNRAAGSTITLPAATGTGNKYRVIVGTTLTSGSLVVAVADNTDYMRGFGLLANDTDGSASNFETANTGTLATESDTITLNRTTTGIGTIGDVIELEDIATDIWSVMVKAQANGTEATPFSAAV